MTEKEAGSLSIRACRLQDIQSVLELWRQAAHYDVAKGYGAYHFQLVQPVVTATWHARRRPATVRR